MDENCLRIFQGRTAISVLIFISWGVTDMKLCERTDGRLVFRAICAQNTGRCLKIQCAQWALWQQNALCNIPLTACFQPTTQAKLQASATYLSDACAGIGHVAGPLAAHWLMFRSRVDRRYWSTLVVAPKCSVIKREEAVMWLNLFIACNKAYGVLQSHTLSC